MANYYFKLKVGTSSIETRYDMPIKESIRYALDETGGVSGIHPYPLYDYIYGKDICAMKIVEKRYPSKCIEMMIH